jgi:chromosome partitioning protein
LLAKKGGVGKSTTSILLYEVLRQAGRTVVVKDWDAQGTSSKALELIHSHKPEAVATADIVIYDTPPNLEHTATATAVRSANIALVIATPAPADVWEAEDAVQFVRAIPGQLFGSCSTRYAKQRFLVVCSKKAPDR